MNFMGRSQFQLKMALTPHSGAYVGFARGSPGLAPQVYPHLWAVPLGTRDNSPAFQRNAREAVLYWR